MNGPAGHSADYIAGYLAGLTSAEAGTRPADYMRGWIDHALAVRASDEADWAAVRETVARTLATPPFAALCDRRGDHARAHRQRSTLAARGITQGAAA